MQIFARFQSHSVLMLLLILCSVCQSDQIEAASVVQEIQGSLEFDVTRQAHLVRLEEELDLLSEDEIGNFRISLDSEVGLEDRLLACMNMQQPNHNAEIVRWGYLQYFELLVVSHRYAELLSSAEEWFKHNPGDPFEISLRLWVAGKLVNGSLRALPMDGRERYDTLHRLVDPLLVNSPLDAENLGRVYGKVAEFVKLVGVRECADETKNLALFADDEQVYAEQRLQVEGLRLSYSSEQLRYLTSGLRFLRQAHRDQTEGSQEEPFGLSAMTLEVENVQSAVAKMSEALATQISAEVRK